MHSFPNGNLPLRAVTALTMTLPINRSEVPKRTLRSSFRLAALCQRFARGLPSKDARALGIIPYFRQIFLSGQVNALVSGHFDGGEGTLNFSAIVPMPCSPVGLVPPICVELSNRFGPSEYGRGRDPLSSRLNYTRKAQ